MKLNNIVVIPRHNRPTVQTKTDLELNFYNNGSYTDPYAISAVYVFKDTAASSAELNYTTNGIPEPLLDLEPSSTRYGLPKLSIVEDAVMTFQNINWDTGFGSRNIIAADFSAGNFTGGVSGASGIYRTGEGQFHVVMVPGASGIQPETSAVRANEASSAGQYFDLWVVQNSENGAWTCYSNKLRLRNDVWVTTTEPLTLTVNTDLKQKYIEMGSKIDLTFQNTYTSENRDIPLEVRDSFRESIVQNAAVRVVKLNETIGYTGQIEVSGFSDTSGVVRVTSDDTVLYSFDTNVLKTLAVANTDFGPPTGIYEVQIMVDVLNNRIYSKKFKVIVK